MFPFTSENNLLTSMFLSVRSVHRGWIISLKQRLNGKIHLAHEFGCSSFSNFIFKKVSKLKSRQILTVSTWKLNDFTFLPSPHQACVVNFQPLRQLHSSVHKSASQTNPESKCNSTRSGRRDMRCLLKYCDRVTQRIQQIQSLRYGLEWQDNLYLPWFVCFPTSWVSWSYTHKTSRRGAEAASLPS